MVSVRSLISNLSRAQFPRQASRMHQPTTSKCKTAATMIGHSPIRTGLRVTSSTNALRPKNTAASWSRVKERLERASMTWTGFEPRLHQDSTKNRLLELIDLDQAF